jgi:hypothetical protein
MLYREIIAVFGMAFVPDALRCEIQHITLAMSSCRHSDTGMLLQSKLTADNSEATASKFPRSAVTCRPIYTASLQGRLSFPSRVLRGLQISGKCSVSTSLYSRLTDINFYDNTFSQSRYVTSKQTDRRTDMAH